MRSTGDPGRQPLLAVVFARIGPYHDARLRATEKLFREKGWRVLALEIARRDREYQWDLVEKSAEYQRVTLFERANSRRLAARDVRSRLWCELNGHMPTAVAVPGWSARAARSSLRWCGRNDRAVILMSDSKRNDMRRKKWKEWIKRRLVAKCGAALVAGTPQAEYLQALGMCAERIFLGYDVVDNALFTSSTDALRQQAISLRQELELPDRFFLTVARFIWEKNLSRLLSAFHEYSQHVEEPDRWSLVICGDGELKAQLVTQAKKLNCGNLVWPGFVQIDDLPKYYAFASGFILPSLKDTWGLVVNEAMASGLPVLVSKKAGCCEDLVRDGENGFVLDPTSVESICEALVRMSSLSEDRRQEMGRRSAEIIQEWGPERFATGMWSAVQAALQHRSVELRS